MVEFDPTTCDCHAWANRQAACRQGQQRYFNTEVTHRGTPYAVEDLSTCSSPTQHLVVTVLPGNKQLADHQPQQDWPGQSKITSVTDDIGRRLPRQTSGGVCCARVTSCMHEPWPTGSVRLFGWRRKMPMPCRIEYIRISQVGRRVSPRLRSEGNPRYLQAQTIQLPPVVVPRPWSRETPTSLRRQPY